MGARLLIRRQRPARLARRRLATGFRGTAASFHGLPDPPELPGVSHRYVSARGLRFHIAEAGPPDGDPVLLLHGWPQHHYEWRHLLPELAKDHRVIALDLRGFGWSDAPRFGYDKENLASDVLAVLDALELDRVKLVGHDWGGWIGFLACLREPDRFSHFLALGIAHPWQSIGPDWRQLPRFWYQLLNITPLLGYALHRTRAYVRLILQGGTATRSGFTPAELDAFVDNLSEPARSRACVSVYRTFVLREALPVARGRYAGTRLRTPTHLLVGDRDPVITPTLVAGYEAHADSMTTEIVPNCGHFIADEYPDLVAARARSHFA